MMPSTTKELEESSMEREIATGRILIKDGALLPKELQLETEPCVLGWRLVKNFDAYALNREIQKTGWTFFCLAGEIKVTVFGIDRQKMVRRAIERILARAKSEKFNSLEITRVALVGSERFPLVHYVTVSVHSRHIQESLFLCRAEDFPKLETGKSEPPSQSTGISSDNTQFSHEPAKEPAAVSILSQ
jgi:hypothetical protein